MAIGIQGTIETKWFPWLLGIQRSRNFAASYKCEAPESFACTAQEHGNRRIDITAEAKTITEAIPCDIEVSHCRGSTSYDFALPDGNTIRIETHYTAFRRTTNLSLNGAPLPYERRREPRGYSYIFDGFVFHIPNWSSLRTGWFNVADRTFLPQCVVASYWFWLDAEKHSG
ncbi:MAG: hypothetical protein V4710_11370 [Verrucomicrobiota bacterium]